LAIALVLSLVTIVPSFADAYEILNIDWVNTCLPDLNDISYCVPAGAYIDFADAPRVFLGNLSGDVAKGAAIIQFVAWYMPKKGLADVGIRIDGGDVDYDGYATVINDLTAAVAGMGYSNAENVMRIIIETPIITEGTHKIEVVAKHTDDTTKVIYEIYYTDSDSVAIGKPVFTFLETVPAGGGKLTSDNVYWNPKFINDGVAPIFEGSEVPLGWYASTTTSDVDSKVYIDLQGIYDIDLVTLDAMGFNNIAFPNTYKIYTSVDGITWTELGGEAGIESVPASFAKDSVFEGKGNARYVLLDCSKFNLLNDGGGIYYGGIGELNVIGKKISDASGRNIFEPVSSYDAGTVKSDGTEAIGAPSAWTGFQTGDLDFDFSFRTDVSFYKIGFPAFWSYPGTPLTFEFVKDGELVHSFNYTTLGDAPVIIDIGKTLPKGTYDVTITITDDEWVEANNGYKCYLVLGFATSGDLYDDDYFTFERGNVAFDLYTTDTAGLGFVPFDYVEPYEPVSRDFDANAGDGLSYDWILANGAEIANGNTQVIETKKGIDGTDGSITELTLYGWYGNGQQETAAFGYQINGGTIVYGDYFTTTEEAVTNLGANNRRFMIPVDVSGLTGENTIWIWAKLANGDEIKLNRFDNKGQTNEKDREVYVIYNGPASQQNPPTADASMIIFMVAAAAVALVLIKRKSFNR